MHALETWIRKPSAKWQLLGIFVFAFLFFLPKDILALGCSPLSFDTSTCVTSIIAWIAEIISGILGDLFVVLTHALINWVAPYSNFIGAQPTAFGDHPVTVGWTVVRDISNMFFIIVLLVIAFGTMFKIETYDYKRTLPRLVVMAILINFSRTITGLVIDAAQVIMLTFVNAFQAAAGGNLVSGLGMQDIFNISFEAPIVDDVRGMATYVFAVIFLAVAVMTMLIILATLIVRIVMLWMITILSPAAFLLSTFPRGQKYYSDWWDKLICWAFSGPVLAFFLWLALATMVAAGGDVGRPPCAPNQQSTSQNPCTKSLTERQIISPAGQEANIVRFLVGILMLLAGVQIGQQFCAVGTGIVSGAGQFVKGKAMGAVRAITRTGVRAGVGTVKAGVGVAAGGVTGAAGWVDYRVKQKYGAGIREKAYGVLGAAGFKSFATERLAKMQEGASKQYDTQRKASTAAAATAPDQFLKTLGAPKVFTPEGDAEYAGRLHAALTSAKVDGTLKSQAITKLGLTGDYKSLSDADKERVDAEVTSQKNTWYTDYESATKRSGNRDLEAGLKEIKKENPHLIPNEDEKRKVAEKLGSAEALKMDASALDDEVVVGALSDAAKDSIRKRGSAEQKAKLDATERIVVTDSPSTRIPNAADRQKYVQSLPQQQLEMLNPAELRRLLPDMTPEQRDRVIKANKVDLSAITAADLALTLPPDATGATPTVAETIAKSASPDELEKLAANPATASDFDAQLTAQIAARVAAGRPPSTQEQAKFDTARAIGGDKNFTDAFGGSVARLEQALKGSKDDVRALLRQLNSKGNLAAGSAPLRSVAAQIRLDDLADMIQGSPEEGAIATEIVDQIKTAAAAVGATRNDRARRNQLLTNPILNRLV